VWEVTDYLYIELVKCECNCSEIFASALHSTASQKRIAVCEVVCVCVCVYVRVYVCV
jgi:hypothetical protein